MSQHGKKALRMNITNKEFISMNRTANGIKGVFDHLRDQLAVLESEIKADEKGKADYERQLSNLERRKEELLKRIEENKRWMEGYDNNMGPIQKRYDDMSVEIGNIYENAKTYHRDGVEVLKREFGYHPEFKRATDTFSATPFHPK
mmetsp:Transcript_2706/g.3856  ORF Transcript_2706/g.3856 Transcript_2706/m.3856 type:complete len:146 (-) Transcript_2706:160-597(-)|eukprot:CAMPEP_0117754410 /NCGR_PEP_ID=MMETSP0947-20121206/12814_1 /TAXON_ID=44440 /ORGANISM="Chattonella subsalsa, Strain CCMP2191" /LENGTH=145 /DNA_ID=CAMNT_0005573497 /DNA_START=53 /DNA_END=490 /DNA_ORIENTATION=+